MKLKDFKALKRQLDKVAQYIICQSRPNTFVIAKVVWQNITYVDFDFSKCHWPDWWNRTQGINIAKGKAIHNIAKRVAFHTDFEGIIQLPGPEGWDLAAIPEEAISDVEKVLALA